MFCGVISDDRISDGFLISIPHPTTRIRAEPVSGSTATCQIRRPTNRKDTGGGGVGKRSVWVLAEDFPDLSGKVLQCKGLLQEGGSRVEPALVKYRVFGVAGEKQNSHFRSQGEEPGCQLASTDAGHDNIGDENINPARTAFRHAQTGLAVRCLENLVPARCQGLTNQYPNRIFVLNQENRFVAAILLLGSKNWACGFRTVVHSRQVDMERSTRAPFALGKDVASALLDD